MGTDFEVKFDSPHDGFVQSLFASGDHLETELSAFRENSFIGRLNAAGVGIEMDMPEHTATLVRLSRYFEAQTHGSFSVAGEPFAEAFEVEGSRIRKKHANARLNFGAIGKGYALDVWASMLAREGIETFLLSAGGSSVVARGNWKWGWAVDRNANGELFGFQVLRKTFSPEIWALGVSGVYEKGEHIWRNSGRRTWQASQRPQRQSALVGSKRATDADALSTALLAGAVLERVPHAWFDETGELFWNLEFSTTFELSRGMAS
jgi:thiamine biosynthesis lipoprotein ApbE